MIHIVENQDQFIKLFPNFKEKSKYKSNPDIYLIGLDCEYISKANNPDSFKTSNNWVQKSDVNTAVCTIQIANNEDCIIFNLCDLKCIPSQLEEILCSNSWIKCGVGITGDITNISNNFNIQICQGILELKLFGELCNIDKPNLKNMYELLGLGTLNKQCLQSDWSKNLTLEQIKYASDDAFASYKLGYMFLQNMISNIKTTIDSTKLNIFKKEDSTKIISIQSGDVNYVGILQEYTQKHKLELPIYDINDHEPNIHPKKFKCSCSVKTIDNMIINHIAINTSKKTAKNDASKLVCEELKLV